jgi:site-specific DNA recombinase
VAFDSVFLDLINEAARKRNVTNETRIRELSSLIDQRQREIQNLLKFLRAGGESPSVQADLRKLESDLAGFRAERDELEESPEDALVMPSVEKLKALARQELRGLAIESYEFAGLMQRLVTELYVVPYRLCDGKDLVLRATFRLQLANLLPDKRVQEVLRGPLERVLTVDLFKPPQRVEYRERVMALRHEITERAVARELGITVTAAQRAAVLDRLMKQLNLADPYLRLVEPPMDYPKMRRHLHSRYHFEPLPGHPQ